MTAPAMDHRRPSFLDPSSPPFLVMAALIVVGAIVLGVQNGEALLAVPGDTLLALAVWVVYGLILVAVAVWLDPWRRPAAATLLGALAWGGIAATAFSSLANSALGELTVKLADADTADAIQSSVLTPMVEESLKIAGIAGLALIAGVRFRGPLDGLVLGTLVGLGFQVVEHFFYTMNEIQSSADVVDAIAGVVFVRGIATGLFTHAVYGGIAGAAIGYAVSRRDRPVARRVAVLVFAVALVAVVHGVLNGFYATQEPTATVFAITAVPVVGFLGVLAWARRDEPRRLAPLAPAAIERGLMTPEEATAISAGTTPAGGRRRQHRQVRYLAAVEETGPDHPYATDAAAGIAPAT